VAFLSAAGPGAALLAGGVHAPAIARVAEKAASTGAGRATVAPLSAKSAASESALLAGWMTMAAVVAVGVGVRARRHRAADVAAARRGRFSWSPRRAAGSSACGGTDEAVAPSALEKGATIGRAEMLRGVSIVSAGVATIVEAPGTMPAARALSKEEADQMLNTYGLSELSTNDVPFGWQVIAEPIGLKGSSDYSRNQLGAEPLMVTFLVPDGWVLTKPNIDYNGTAGTVQVNDYGKGDSAILYVDPGFTGQLADIKQPQYKDILFKAISQKGKNFIDSIEVTKVSDLSEGRKSIEFDWTLASAAGFQIARTGFATLVQGAESKSLQCLWTGTTTPRWKNMKEDLKRITSSFRVGKMSESAARAALEEKEKYLEEAEEAGQFGRLY